MTLSAISALCAAVSLCYWNSLNGDLVFDDLAAVRDNRDIRPHTPVANLFRNDFWGTSLAKESSHKSYRPLSVLTFRLNYAVHGLNPKGYHLVNMLLHAVVCLLFYRLCRHFLSWRSSLVSALLFAVHPIHTEAVSSIVGRAELLSAVAFLCALLFYIHTRYQAKTNVWWDCVVTTLFATFGFLCKEQSLTVLAVCCIYEIVLPKNNGRLQSFRHLMLGRKFTVSPWVREKLSRIILMSTATFLVIYCRWKRMGQKMPHFSRFDNPASTSEAPIRQLTYSYLLTVNAHLLLFPHPLCCDWGMSTVPLVIGWTDARNLITVAFCIACFCFLKNAVKLDEEGRSLALMSACLVVVPFLPASNLLFPVGFVVAERVLYLPSMGFCMMVAHGWTNLYEKRYCKVLAALGLMLLLTSHTLKTISRNKDWQSEWSLYSSALSINPRNGKLHNNMGGVLEQTNQWDEALNHYQTAIKMEPGDVRSYLNTGRVLTRLRRYREAEDVYRQAKAFFPSHEKSLKAETVSVSHLQLFLNLATLISKNESRLEEADELYQEVLNLRADFTNAYLNRGDVLLKLNRSKEAEIMYYQALDYDDTNPDLHYNLGVVLMDQGRNAEALQQLNKALDIEPDHERSLELSAILLQESNSPGYRNLARVRLEKIVDRGQETVQVYIHLGLFAVENRNYNSAEKWFLKALSSDPECREALFNLALLLTEQSRGLEATPYLHLLLKNHPRHIKGLLLMADINVNVLRNFDAAEECYRQVLSLEPENAKARHNLCVVDFERQHFATAERCFLGVLSSYPDTESVRHHLDVVRNVLQKTSFWLQPVS